MAITKDLQDGLHMIAQGKEEGFNILYSCTYNYVYNKAKFIMKNEEDALDLTQETYIQAYRSIGSLEDADNLYAWLGGIVYRQGMKIFRKKRELLVNEDSENIFENVISEDADTSPEDAAQAKVTSEIIMSMIEDLPELQRSAILAFYYDNMKIDDIAGMFECSSNTIKSRLNYAKKFLKSKVEEHEKQNRYKLCSLSPAIILSAFKSLFTTEAYTLSKEVAQTVYNTSCSAVGLTPSVLTVSASAVTQATSAAGTAIQAGTAAIGTQADTVTTTILTKAGLTLSAKIGIGLASLATVGTVATGTILLSENRVPNTPSVQEAIGEVVLGEEISGESTDNSDASSTTGTPVLPTDPDHSHSYVSAVTKEATCSEVGETTYTCDCGDIYIEEIAQLSHTESDWIIASGSFEGTDITWKIVGTTLYVDGEGAIPGFDESGPWFTNFGEGYGNQYVKAWEMYYDVVDEIVLSEGITDIGKNNFGGFSKVKSLSFPSTLTSIGKYALNGMGLTSLVIPESVTDIGLNAFGSLQNLTYVYIPSHIKKIPDNCFSGCYNLSKIEIEDGITEIGEGAFSILAWYDLDGVRHGGSPGFEIYVPASVTKIGDFAFATGDSYGPITVYGKTGSYVEQWIKEVNTQPEVTFVSQ